MSQFRNMPSQEITEPTPKYDSQGKKTTKGSCIYNLQQYHYLSKVRLSKEDTFLGLSGFKELNIPSLQNLRSYNCLQVLFATRGKNWREKTAKVMGYKYTGTRWIKIALPNETLVFSSSVVVCGEYLLRRTRVIVPKSLPSTLIAGTIFVTP